MGRRFLILFTQKGIALSKFSARTFLLFHLGSFYSFVVYPSRDMIGHVGTTKEQSVAWSATHCGLRPAGRSAASAAIALVALLVPATAGDRGNSVLLHGQINSAPKGMTMASDMPPPPDYERVMEEEFQAALAEGTSTALIRFIARHPDHPLADRARSLLSRQNVLDGSVSPTDPDADVYAAFDSARRQNTAAAFRNFIALHSHHPLAAEARRQIARLRQGK